VNANGSDRVYTREVLEHLNEKASPVPLQREEKYTTPSSGYGATSCSLISGNFYSWSTRHRMRPPHLIILNLILLYQIKSIIIQIS
jgi:hypothetical protein